MVCLFCDYNYHETKNCHIYKTEEARKKHPNFQRLCLSCFGESAVPHLIEDEICKSNENCLSRYSIEHHLLFCKERIACFQFFLPKIDKNLSSRFLKTLEMDEKYSLVLSSPSTVNFIKLDPIRIRDSFKNGDNFSKFDFFNGSMTFKYSNMEKDQDLFNAISSKTIICLPKIIDIDHSNLSSEILLQLLSVYTKELRIVQTIFTPDITSTDIIKKAPNLESLSVFLNDKGPNIKFEPSWIQDLIKYKKGKNFRDLCIQLDDVVELDVKSLVEFVSKKCLKNAHFAIMFDLELLGDNNEGLRPYIKIVTILQKHFAEDKGEDENVTGNLIVGFQHCDAKDFFTMQMLNEEIEDKIEDEG